VRVPAASGLAAVRRLARRLPLYKAFHSIEGSLLVLVAAVVDATRGDLAATRALAAALFGLALLTCLAHLAAILSSERLR
jgi:hypothetical protein